MRERKKPHSRRFKTKKGDSRGGGIAWGQKASRRGPTLPPAREVPSALPGLTAVFGMGTGGAPALDPSALKSQQKSST